jgi:hypothetical protein
MIMAFSVAQMNSLLGDSRGEGINPISKIPGQINVSSSGYTVNCVYIVPFVNVYFHSFTESFSHFRPVPSKFEVQIFRRPNLLRTKFMSNRTQKSEYSSIYPVFLIQITSMLHTNRGSN